MELAELETLIKHHELWVRSEGSAGAQMEASIALIETSESVEVLREAASSLEGHDVNDSALFLSILERADLSLASVATSRVSLEIKEPDVISLAVLGPISASELVGSVIFMAEERPFSWLLDVDLRNTSIEGTLDLLPGVSVEVDFGSTDWDHD